jgi:DNA polymerase-1
MYLDYQANHWAFDIEGDLIPSTQIYCICATNIITKEEVQLTTYDEMREWFNQRLKEKAVFVGHNILGYDIPTMRRILGISFPSRSVVDTFLMSMLYSPSIKGGHSLAAWGRRVRSHKSEFSDFSHFSQAMLDYCQQDVNVTRLVYITLIDRMIAAGFTEKSCHLEHLSWHLVQKQKEHGFGFDEQAALKLYTHLQELEDKLKDEIYEYWPPRLEPVRVFKRPFKRDGKPSANYLKHCEVYPKVELHGAEYTAFDYVSFNIGSPPQRVEKLLALGWVPREFTKKTDKGGGGNPKPTSKGKLSASLVEFVEENDKPEVRLIARWIEINSRASMVNTWMEAYNSETKAIHGSLFITNTLRYKHSAPNTANIPAVRLDDNDVPLRGLAGVYTYEARDLWGLRDPENNVLVGVDASGIQLRILAEYLGNDRFTESVLSEDPHTANMELFKLPTRPLTKTITYATLMGAGDAKVAGEAKISLKEAKDVKKLFFEAVPELPELIAKLKAEVAKTGRITLCDGSRIMVNQDYMVIPYLLQGDESRIMRRAAVETYLQSLRREITYYKVGDIHDEHQNEVQKTRSVEFANEVCPDAFLRAGQYHNYSVPIECSAKIGLTWAETH